MQRGGVMSNNPALPVTKHLTASSATGLFLASSHSVDRPGDWIWVYRPVTNSVIRLSRKHFKPTCVYVTKMMPTITIPQQSLSHPSLARQTTSFSLHTYMECRCRKMRLSALLSVTFLWKTPTGGWVTCGHWILTCSTFLLLPGITVAQQSKGKEIWFGRNE